MNGTRRRALTTGAGALAAVWLGGCTQVAQAPVFRSLLDGTERLTRWAQRWLGGPMALAPTYAEADISRDFRGNGTVDPEDDDYQDLAADNFESYRLDVTGLVAHPRSFSLVELRAMPSRTQITRHDCVEGWSCIGKWTGVELRHVLEAVGLAPDARYIVFRCADLMTQGLPTSKYYESIDLDDAFHPQTILAYDMNGETLSVRHGAPVRLRVERQLGYKMAKYVMAIEAVGSFTDIGAGKGGYWEDLGYTWYAGI